MIINGDPKLLHTLMNHWLYWAKHYRDAQRGEAETAQQILIDCTVLRACKTCVFSEDDNCPIFKTARETQIQNVQLADFGCVWHTTQHDLEIRHPEIVKKEVKA